MTVSTEEYFDGAQWVVFGQTPPTVVVPSAPQTLVTTPLSTQITVSCSIPASDGGSAVTGYTWTITPTAGGSTSTVTTAATVLTKVWAGLTASTSYDVTVSATNGVGTGPSVSRTVATGAASTGGRPTASNTGCRTARGSLTAITGAAAGNLTKGATPQRNFTNYLITGPFQPWCNNVTFTDCIFESVTPGTRSAFYMIRGFNGSLDTSGATVTHCTFSGAGSVSGGSIDTAIECGTNWTVTFSDISGCQDGIHPASGSVVTDNYVHGNAAPVGAHADGIQLFGGSINTVSILRNNFDVSDGLGSMNAAFQTGTYPSTGGPFIINNVTVADNWFNGGGYTASGYFNNCTLTNMTYVRNRFGLSFPYSTPIYPAARAQLWSDPSNVYDVTGTSTGGVAVTAGSPVV